MSWRIQSRNAKIKSIEVITPGKVVKAQLTTFRKVNKKGEEPEFKPSVWFAVFYSQAAGLAESLSEGTLVKIAEAYIAKEPYEDKDTGENRWPSTPTVVVYQMELAESSSTPSPKKSNPKQSVPDVDDDEFPF